MSGVALAARLLLAAVFLIAAASKVRDRPGLHTALGQLGVSERLRPLAGVALCLVELGVGVALIVPASAWAGSLVAAGLLIGFCAVIARSMISGQHVDCHCFGQLHSEPLGGRSLVRNGVLLGGAVVVAASGSGSHQLDPVSWYGGLASVDQVLVAVIAALVIVVGAQTALVLELFARHGEILSRLRELERPATGAAVPAVAAPGGLRPGTLAPGFSLPALDGEMVSLSGLLAREHPALLVFSDPRCGPCNAMLDDLVDWTRRFAGVFTLVLISRGQLAEVAAKLDGRSLEVALIDEAGSAAVRYEAVGTPSAVLVGGDGRVARPMAMGPDAIAELVADLGREAAPPELVLAQIGGAR